MKKLDVNHYVDKLSKIYPDVNEEDIKNIILKGNYGLTNGLKKSNAARFKSVGKSIENDELNSYLFYTFRPMWVNNKQCNIKKNKDAK